MDVTTSLVLVRIGFSWTGDGFVSSRSSLDDEDRSNSSPVSCLGHLKGSLTDGLCSFDVAEGCATFSGCF